MPVCWLFPFRKKICYEEDRAQVRTASAAISSNQNKNSLFCNSCQKEIWRRKHVAGVQIVGCHPSLRHHRRQERVRGRASRRRGKCSPWKTSQKKLRCVEMLSCNESFSLLIKGNFYIAQKTPKEFFRHIFWCAIDASLAGFLQLSGLLS